LWLQLVSNLAEVEIMANKKRPKKERIFRARLTDHQFNKLETFARRRGVTMTHVLNEYIRRLPNPSEDENLSTS